MAKRARTDSGEGVRLFPRPDHHIPGVPAAELLVTSDVAERLLAYRPAAFTTDRPEGWKDAENPITSVNLPEPPEPEASPPDEADGASDAEKGDPA